VYPEHVIVWTVYITHSLTHSLTHSCIITRLIPLLLHTSVVCCPRRRRWQWTASIFASGNWSTSERSIWERCAAYARDQQSSYLPDQSILCHLSSVLLVSIVADGFVLCCVVLCYVLCFVLSCFACRETTIKIMQSN
jgi:hypothetical protein